MAQASATPSKVAVPRPTSSSKTKERAEAWPDPRDAEEVHEALQWMGFVDEAEAPEWREHLEVLGHHPRLGVGRGDRHPGAPLPAREGRHQQRLRAAPQPAHARLAAGRTGRTLLTVCTQDARTISATRGGGPA